MKKTMIGVACALLWTHGVFAAQNFTIPDRIEKLAERASDSANITLDGPLLQLAAAFLNGNDKDQKIAKDLISKLKSIRVRNFEFDRDDAYSDRDLDPIREQLKAPGWARIIESREKGEHTQIFLKTDKNQIAGVVILSAERRELSIVIIDGMIDLQQLSRLGGNFGIPKDLPAVSRSSKGKED